MIVTTLKRTEKKNALDQIKPVGELDNIKSLDIKDSNIGKVLKDYEEVLKERCEIDFKVSIDDIPFAYHTYKGSFWINTVLSPKEITILTTIMHVNYEDHENFNPNTGFFLTNLIQNSYNEGFNNFYFEMNNSNFLGTSIKGSEENPIVMSMGSNYKEQVGLCAKHSTFNIKENHGASLGSDARHSTFNIEKNHGFHVGEQANNCTFNIKENHGERVAEYSKNSTIYLKENHGKGVGEHAENCIFKSPDKKTLNSIIANPEYNHFNLIQPDGEEIPYEK